MKYFYYLFFILFIFSCTQKKSDYSEGIDLAVQKTIDSIDADVYKQLDEESKKSYSDKNITQNSPIQVTEAKFVKEEYSNYKGVRLTFKNVSKKDIQAIRFEWYGENSFAEPADMGVSKGEGGGFTEELIKAGQTKTANWDLISKDGKIIIGARAYEVAFTDGSKWKLEK